MLIYLFQTVWSLPTTTDYERQQPTHTNPLLDQSSYNPISHKATTTRILTRRAQLVCDLHESLQDETDYLNTVLVKTNTTRTLSTVTNSNADAKTQTNVNSGPVTTATTSYFRGTSQLSHLYYTSQPITTFNYDFLEKSRGKTK